MSVPSSLNVTNPSLASWPVAYDYRNGAVTYNPAVLDQQPLNTRVFILATVFAQHAQSLRDKKYGSNRREPTGITESLVEDFLQRDIPGYRSEMMPEITGYLDRCLIDRKLLPPATNNSPRDPRILYANHLGIPLGSDLVMEFASGFATWPFTPRWLLPPRNF